MAKAYPGTRERTVRQQIAACAGSESATAQLRAQLTTELQAHVKGQLAPYEYPKEIEFVDALPMTTSGKVQRRVLRLQEEQRYAVLRPSAPAA